MDIEIIGLLGFAFTATAFAMIAYERRLDVLYGPYIQGRETTLEPGIFSHRSLSGAGKSEDDLPRDQRLLVTLMKVENSPTPRERAGFKIVCSDCGSLSIKIKDPANASSDAKIECGRCSAVRGTLADLHVLARRGNDVFEF
jgi:hypothetical protein